MSDNSQKLITIAFASRFGSTAKLAEQIAIGLQSTGRTPHLVDVAKNTSVAPQQLVVLTPIIWDRPVPAMREWIAANGELIRQYTVACGVVCGSAGVRENGGMIYARQLAKRIGRSDVFQFALSGEIPPRERLLSWEWRALRIFAGLMRKPELFTIHIDETKARLIGNQIGSQIPSNQMKG